MAANNDHDGISVEYTSTNVEIYNCILAYNARNGTTLAPGSTEDIAELWVHGIDGFASNHNMLFGYGHAYFGNQVFRGLVEYNDTLYDNLSAYQGASGRDANSRSAEPMFADTVNGNYVISSSGSEALDRGKTDLTGWVWPWWLSADPRGFAPHDVAGVPNAGSGTPAYADIGAFEYDVAPAAVTYFHSDVVTSQSVHLLWTASADDGAIGTAAAYADLRYSLSPILTDPEFAAATQVSGEPVPSSPGSQQGYTVSWLTMCTSYYFALKFGDANGNVSVLGDTAQAITGGVPYHGFWICDDGGGERARLWSDARLSAGAGRAADAGATVGGQTTTSTAAASTGSGTALMVEAAPGASGLDLRLVALVGDAPGYQEAGRAGVLYQTPDGAGGWTTRLQYGLPEGSCLALLAPERPARWVFLEPLALQAVLSTVVADGTAWRLEQAHHSRFGDVTATLTTGDQPPALSPGDTLAVHYAGVPTVGEPASGWLVVLDKPTSGTTLARASGGNPEPSSSVPGVFALHQNQPNPFRAASAIRFDLPRPEPVRLEVFDLMGRKVATLRDAWMPQGRYSLEWNSRDANGSPVQPGAYLYRLTAGSFRAQKKLVVLR